MPNPKYKINNFTKDNIYWMKEMLPVNTGGYNAITSGYSSISTKNKDTSGYSSLSDMIASKGCSDFQVGASEQRTLLLYDGNSIYSSGTSSTSHGKIHTILNDGSPTYTSTNPDILTTPNNNILYTSAGHLGVGYYFQLTSGSDATSLVCSTATFITWGVAASAGHNKIYNLTLGQEFTVDTTVTETDITVTAVAGKVPAEGDYCVAFVDDKFDILTGETVEPQFVGQQASSTWVRQIRRLDDRTFILNGNFLSMLSTDETTLTEDYQQFPVGVQGTCFDVNNDLMLIGAKSKGNSGMLMVYDGFSTYFKSIINTDSIPIAITPYQSGWIVLFDSGELKYTDGVSYKKLSNFPDCEIVRSLSTFTYNGLKLFSDKVFITASGSSSLTLRQQSGAYVYDIDNDIWSYTALRSYGGYIEKTSPSLYPLNMSGTGQQLFYGSLATIGYISSGSGSSNNKEIFLNIKLPKKDQIKNIELNLASQYNQDYNSDNVTYGTVTVSAWDGRYGLYTFNQADADSTKTQINTNQVGRSMFVGQEVFILGNDSLTTKNDHEYTYVTAINNPGEATESITVSPELTADFGSEAQNIKMLGFKLLDTRTVNYSEINKNNTFNVKDFNGDKLYLHIRISGLIDLLGVNLY